MDVVSTSQPEGYSYDESLRILGVTSLETRFFRADLIEIFQILKGFENVDPDSFNIHDP